MVKVSAARYVPGWLTALASVVTAKVALSPAATVMSIGCLVSHHPTSCAPAQPSSPGSTSEVDFGLNCPLVSPPILYNPQVLPDRAVAMLALGSDDQLSLTGLYRQPSLVIWLLFWMTPVDSSSWLSAAL